MKKIYLVIMGTILTCFFAFGEENKDGFVIAQDVVNSINISVDPRIELLSIIQYLAGDKNSNKGYFKYIERIDEYFKNYKEHEAVKYYAKLNKNGFDFDAPPHFMLYLTYDLNENKEKIDDTYNEYIISRIGGEEVKDKLVSLIKDFSVKSNFKSFYSENINYYNKIIEEHKQINKTNYVEIAEKFYGIKQNSYNSILVSLYSNSNYGPRIKAKEGKYDIYNIMPPVGYKSEIPLFKNDILFHEFSHSYINPLTEANPEKIWKYFVLFRPIELKMKYMAYGNWIICVNEHLVRAADILLSEKAYGSKETTKKITKEKENGFIYIEKIIEALRKYDANRDKYNTIAEFYPELIGVFGEYIKPQDKAESDKFSGNIISTISNNGKMVIIIPTQEKEKTIQLEIQNYANITKGYLKKIYGIESEIVEDINVNEEAIKECNIMVFGTVDGNIYLKKIMKKMPFVIEKEKVIVNEKEIKSENIGIISCYFNPLNSKRGIMVFTGQNIESVKNILNMPIQDTSSYMVAEGKNIIEEGVY